MYIPCDRYTPADRRDADDKSLSLTQNRSSRYHNTLARSSANPLYLSASSNTFNAKNSMVYCRSCFGELKTYLKTFKSDSRTYLSSSWNLTPDVTVGEFCKDYLIRSHRKRSIEPDVPPPDNSTAPRVHTLHPRK